MKALMCVLSAILLVKHRPTCCYTVSLRGRCGQGYWSGGSFNGLALKTSKPCFKSGITTPLKIWRGYAGSQAFMQCSGQYGHAGMKWFSETRCGN